MMKTTKKHHMGIAFRMTLFVVCLVVGIVHFGVSVQPAQAGALLTYPLFRAWDDDGNPLNGGKLHTYSTGTSTEKASYSNRECTTAHTNPIELDSNGEATVYLLGTYKLILMDADDITLWTMDNVQGVGQNVTAYEPDYQEADQGVDSGTSNTIKYIVDTVRDDNATILLRHNSGASRTIYYFDTAETIPANFTIDHEPGAIINTGSGGTVTINSHPQEGLQQLYIPDAAIKFGTTHTPIVHPHWFGGLADGSTDDSTAWQSGFDSFPAISGGVGGGKFQVPAGTSVLSTGIIWPNDGTECTPIDVVGFTVGNYQQVSYIDFNDETGTLFDLRNGDGSDLNFSGSIRNLTAIGVNATSASYFIEASSMKASVLENLQVIYFKYGIYLSDTSGSVIYAKWDNLYFLGQTSGIKSSALFNSVNLNRFRTKDCTDIAIHLGESPGSVSFTNCIIEGSDSYGVQVDNAVKVSFKDNYFEGNTTSDIYVTTASAGFYNTLFYASGNDFNGGGYSITLEEVPTAVIIGNKLTAVANNKAINIVGQKPHGIVVGNEGPWDDDLIMAVEDNATMITGDALNPHVGLHYRFPVNVESLILGSVFFNNNANKGVLATVVSESGAGSGTSLNGDATTCTTTSGATTISTLSSMVDLYRGVTINVAGETFGTGDDFATIMYVGASSIILDKAAVTGVPTAALTYNAAARQEIRGVPLERVVHSSASSGSTTVEVTLETAVVPPNYFLSPQGSWVGGLRIIAAGTKTGSNDNKTIAFYYSGTSITPSTAANDTNDWRIEVELVARGASDSQIVFWKAFNGSTVTQGNDAFAIDATKEYSVSIIGKCDNASDTITQTLWHVESF